LDQTSVTILAATSSPTTLRRHAWITSPDDHIKVCSPGFATPVAYYRQGLRLVESEGAGFPIAGYDELNVKEIGDRLDGMSAAEIRTVREYEKRNKNRETLIE